MRPRALLRIGLSALVCFACTGPRSDAGGQSGTEVAVPAACRSRWHDGPVGLDEPVPPLPSDGGGGSGGTSAVTPRMLLQAVIAKGTRGGQGRLSGFGGGSSDSFAHFETSFSGEPSEADASICNRLKFEGITLHVATADGSLDERVSGFIEGDVAGDATVTGFPLRLFNAGFTGFLSLPLHGTYDLSAATNGFAQPLIVLNYGPDFGFGTLVVVEASDVNTGTGPKTTITSWGADADVRPPGTGGGCQGQGGGGPAVDSNYTAGTSGLCFN